MKIRILDNSIRLRFSQSELNELGISGSICKSMKFPNGDQFKYGLFEVDGDLISSEMRENEIKVLIPKAKVDELINTDLVGVKEDFDGLKILIEKDFKCLTDREEDETDLFENPMAGEESC